MWVASWGRVTGHHRSPISLSRNLTENQDLYSQSGRTSYRKISCSLEAAKLYVIIIVSFWNLTGISAEMPVKFQSDWKSLNLTITVSRLHEILQSGSVLLVNRAQEGANTGGLGVQSPVISYNCRTAEISEGDGVRNILYQVGLWNNA